MQRLCMLIKEKKKTEEQVSEVLEVKQVHVQREKKPTGQWKNLDINYSKRKRILKAQTKQ